MDGEWGESWGGLHVGPNLDLITKQTHESVYSSILAFNVNENMASSRGFDSGNEGLNLLKYYNNL